MNWNETAIYVLGFCVGFVAAWSFRAWMFRFSDRACANRVCSLGLPIWVVNLELDKSLKWLLFNIVSVQITSDALWK